MKIVVINNGFVLVCRGYSQSPEGVTLTKARCIRVWGTTEGLGQLVNGPTSDTVLDAMIPVVSVRSRPNGLPIANTRCPTSRSAELPNTTGTRASGGASIFSTATSVAGSCPTSVA